VTLHELMGLRHAGPAGWIAGAGWIAAAVASVALLRRTALRPGAPWGRLGAATLACSGAGLAACVWVVAGARRRMLAVALGIDDGPVHVDLRWLGAFESTEVALFVAGAGLLWCASLLALAVIASAARAEGRLRGSPRRLALALTIAGFAAVMGLAATQTSGATARAWGERMAPWDLLRALVSAADAPLAAAWRRIVVVAVIGWIAGALASRRARERPFGRGAAIGAVAVFVLGLAAFAATRGMAGDAHHPIPSDRLDYLGCPVLALDPQGLPIGAGSEPLGESSILELHPGEAILGGQTAPLESPADLDELLRKRRELWVQVTRRPERSMPPVLVVAPAFLGTVEIAIWLRGIEQHLERGFIVVVAEPERRFPTQTLGELTATPHCGGILVLLDPAGRALTSVPTWGDLAAERGDGGAPIRVRLR
jgi:hypothetical protein